MRHSVRAALAVVMTSAAAPALASDLAARTGAFANSHSLVSGYSWSGAYLGVNLGYQWARISHFGGHPSGAAGGAQAGYNWQAGRFVLGGEADLQVSEDEDTFAARKFSNPWFGSVRGRAGFAVNNALFYATAGLAYGDLRVTLAGVAESKQHVGWAAGAGMEVGLSGNWAARAEYLMTDLSDRGYVLTGVTNGVESNLLRFGVNYRF